MKRLKNKICICFISFVLLMLPFVTACGGYTANNVTRLAALKKAQTAQYLPNADLLVDNEPGTNAVLSMRSADQLKGIGTRIALEDYNRLVEQIGWLDSPFNREFTVSDIKDEIEATLSNVNRFGSWVYVYGGIPYGRGVNTPERLKIDYNTKKDVLTIESIAGFVPRVWDPNSNQIIETQEGGNINYAYKKISYYTDESGREVVECEIVDTIAYKNKIYPQSYQYVKNVKDTSFTKYLILSENMRIVQGNDGVYMAADLDTEKVALREFIQLDYGNEAVSVLIADQRMASAYNGIRDYSTIKYFYKDQNDLYLYNTMFSFGENKTYLNSINELLSNNVSLQKNNIVDYFVETWYWNWNSLRYFGTDYGGENLPVRDPNYRERSTDTITANLKELRHTTNGETAVIIPEDHLSNSAERMWSGAVNQAFKSFQSMQKNLTNQTASDYSIINPESECAALTFSNWDDVTYESKLTGLLDTLADSIMANTYFVNNYAAVVKQSRHTIDADLTPLRQ